MRTMEIMEQKIKEYQNRVSIPGSFDPATYGHLDMIISVLEAFPEITLHVIVAFNEAKKNSYDFSPEERVYLLEQMIPEKYRNRVKVVIEKGIVARYLKKESITKIAKGVRDAKDYEYEAWIAEVNSMLNKKLQSIFVPQDNPKLRNVSSSFLKDQIRLNIDATEYAPALTREALQLRLRRQWLVGVTGGIAAGKSTIVSAIQEFYNKHGAPGDMPVHYIELDKLGKVIYGNDLTPEFVETRYLVAKEKVFGEEVLNPDTSIDTYKLGTIAFSSRENLNKLSEIVLPQILSLMNDELNRLGPGIFLIEGANIVENSLTSLFNENLILVEANPEEQEKRLIGKSYTGEQIKRRLEFQFSGAERFEAIKGKQSKERDRFLTRIDGLKDVDRRYRDMALFSASDVLDPAMNVIQELYSLLQKEYQRRAKIIRP